MLRLLVDPGYFKSLVARVDDERGVRFMQGSCTGLEEGTMHIEGVVGSHDEGKKWDLEFDYAVVGSGSQYASLKPGADEGEPSRRVETWRGEAERLKKAASIAVIGGGPVGVEMAAEVAVAYPHKRVTLIDSNTALCSPFADPRSASYVFEWLKKRGVEASAPPLSPVCHHLSLPFPPTNLPRRSPP